MGPMSLRSKSTLGGLRCKDLIGKITRIHPTDPHQPHGRGVAGGLAFDGWLSCCDDFPRRFSEPESTALNIRALDLLSVESFGDAPASTGGEFDVAPSHFSKELLGSLLTATAIMLQ